MNTETTTRHDLEARIVQHSWESEKETAGSRHIVLQARAASAGELSESDLEKVAGGGTPVVTAVATAVVATLSGVMVGTIAAIHGPDALAGGDVNCTCDSW
jgi:hypothetical protein